MDLLFKRSQKTAFARKYFRLHAKVELTSEERSLIRKYSFDQSVLIDTIQPNLIRNAAFATLAAYFFSIIIFTIYLFNTYRGLQQLGLPGIVLFGLAPLLVGYFYYHQTRETIYVRDLMHGRYFKCRSVCELARKEAYLEYITGYFRQAVESAKNWDGHEKHEILPLPKDEAKKMILSGPLF